MMKTFEELTKEYICCNRSCEECSENLCSDEKENCCVDAEYEAFKAGYKAAQDTESDLKFIIEIIDDLKRNGYQQGGMAATMLKDWQNELYKKMKDTPL